jgi:hypothetical protein
MGEVVDDGLVDKRNLRQRDKAIVGRLANPKVVKVHRKISKKKVPVLRLLIQGTAKSPYRRRSGSLLVPGERSHKPPPPGLERLG